jgi:hypothetical protein
LDGLERLGGEPLFTISPSAILVNTSMEVRTRDGRLETLYGLEIFGTAAGKRTPRWSIARDVLQRVN